MLDWENMNKIISYIGFAIKSNSYIAGQTAIKESKKTIYLILLSNDSTSNLIDLAKNTATKHKCEVIHCKNNLQELTHLPNVKIFAITNESIAKAIIQNKEIIKIG